MLISPVEVAETLQAWSQRSELRAHVNVTITYVVIVLASTSSCILHDGREKQFSGSHWKENALKFRTKVIIPNITASCTPHKLRVSPTSAPVKACHRAILWLENQVDDSSQPRLSKCGCQLMETWLSQTDIAVFNTTYVRTCQHTHIATTLL